MAKIAVIDIGSNSVRLMMWADGKTLYKRLNTARLGEGIAQTSCLREEAIMRTAQSVAEYFAQAKEEGAQSVYAFATAAVRSAKNGSAFCVRVKRLCGLNVDVVSGEEEAELAVAGALLGGDGCVIDVGGASTEVCVRKNGATAYSQSFPIGAVRLFDACGEDKASLLCSIEEKLRPLAGQTAELPAYAVGGTATTLAAVTLGLTQYDPKRIQGFELTSQEIARCADRLLKCGREERKNLAGMDPCRADIIAGGALLLSETVKRLHLEKIAVSDRDNLEGYLYRRKLI